MGYLEAEAVLVAGRFTEADLRLYPTMIRYDAVYATLFRCCRRRVKDYPNLHAWTRDVYQLSVGPAPHQQVASAKGMAPLAAALCARREENLCSSLCCGVCIGMWLLDIHRAVLKSVFESKHVRTLACNQCQVLLDSGALLACRCGTVLMLMMRDEAISRICFP